MYKKYILFKSWALHQFNCYVEVELVSTMGRGGGGEGEIAAPNNIKGLLWPRGQGHLTEN